MIDLYIILIAFLGFILFFFIHIVVFRIIPKKEVIKGLIYSYFFATFLLIFAEFIFIKHLSLLGFFISFFMYSFFALVYVLGVFGMMDSSLRIRLLTEIAHAGKSGIDSGALHQLYNKEVIISKRLSRLTNAGVINFSNGFYRTSNRITYFTLHAILYSIMRYLFERENR